MLAQSTLISYHIEAFVKTEVACTVEAETTVVRDGEENFLRRPSETFVVVYCITRQLFNQLLVVRRQSGER